MLLDGARFRKWSAKLIPVIPLRTSSPDLLDICGCGIPGCDPFMASKFELGGKLA
jgi:hypothetical protein